MEAREGEPEKHNSDETWNTCVEKQAVHICSLEDTRSADDLSP
jgi:hypothetical protein